jgi:hypothetical protein
MNAYQIRAIHPAATNTDRVPSPDLREKEIGSSMDLEGKAT